MGLHTSQVEVKALRGDELAALDQAHYDAKHAASRAANEAQNTARKEAKRVRILSDEMARKDRSYQDLTNKLQNRVEDVADVVQDHAEALARRSGDRLEHHLWYAKHEVRMIAERHFEALDAVQKQFQELENKAGTQTFLAKSRGKAVALPADWPAPIAFGALSACIVFFVKGNRRPIQRPEMLLG